MALNVQANAFVTAAEREAFSGFIHQLELNGRSQNTLASYVSDWLALSGWFHEQKGGMMSLRRLRPDDLEQYRSDALKRGTAPRTLNRRLNFLKVYADYCYQLARISRDSHDSLRAIAPLDVDDDAPRGLSAGERRRYMAEVKHRASTRDRALIQLMLSHGLRPAELAQLRIDDVSEAGSRLRLRLRERAEEALELRRGPAAVVSQLVQERKRSGGRGLFVGRRGELSEDGIARIVSKYAEFAGLEVTPRVLRRTFAHAYLGRHNNDEVGLARAMGFKSVRSSKGYVSADEPPRYEHLKLSELPVEQLGSGNTRQSAQGERLQLTRDVYQPGAELAEHAHPEEQLTLVLEGKLAFQVAGEIVELQAGELVRVASQEPHSLRVLGKRPSIALNVYSPPRKEGGITEGLAP